MKRLRAALPVLIAIVATWSITTATNAQTSIPAWVFVRDSFGQDWLVINGGKRVAVPLYGATDDEINALPWTGTWAIPNPDGSSVAQGSRPSWDVSAAPPGPASGNAPAPAGSSAPEDPVKLSGDRGQNTKPFDLRGGDYSVKWRTELRSGSSSCFSGASIYRVEGKRHIESLYSVLLDRAKKETSASGETQLYGLDSGAYYLDVNTTACSWSVEIRPQ